MVLSTKGISTERCFSSSPVSGGAIESLIVEVGLFEALEKDFIYGYSIKTILNNLDVTDAPVEVVEFLVTFGPFFDQIHADFQCKHDTKTKMAPKETEISKAWNLASESE